MIHKEGTVSIILALIVGAGFVFLFNWLTPNMNWIGWTLAIALLIIILQFFRNPKRSIEEYDDNLVYAPADGKVVIIEETQEDEYFKAKRLMVSVFMSPINVHVNRNPFSGAVTYFKYHAGKYLVAWHPKSSTENERTTVVMSNGKSEVMLRQVAGALARRIVCYVNKGDKVKQGDDFGFIKFGSRVDIYLPLDANIKVKLEDVVKGNKNIIARLK
jgi:phosphatidylserine decarboxylase